MPCVAHLMLVMLRPTPFVAHLVLVMVLNLLEQSGVIFVASEYPCSSERNDLITVSSTWELTPVGTRYS